MLADRGSVRFHGSPLRTASVEGLLLLETVHRAGLEVPEHAHDGLTCCLVIAGSLEEETRAGRRMAQRSSLIVRGPHAAHANRFGPAGARCFNAVLGRAWLRRFGLEEIAGWTAARVPGSRTSWLAHQVYAELREGEASLVLNGLLLAVLGEVLGDSEPVPGGRPPAWLRRAEESLRSGCFESIDLSAVARDTGIHPTHFARTFRRYHGCTPGEFVRRLRIEQACRWIEAGVQPLAEIAVRSGFSDQAHFGRHFRRVTGMTPGAYRRLHAAKRVPARSLRSRRITRFV